MVERRKPIVTELALADALDQLVNLIEELRVDVALRVEITTDETELVKLVFSGTPTGLPAAARGPLPFPPRSFAVSGTRACATTRPRTAPATPSDAGKPRHAHSEQAQQGVTPNDGGRVITKALRRNPTPSSAMPTAPQIYPGSAIANDDLQVSQSA